ncbi:MAG TPA: transcription termination/antitermination NusG family protein [Terracidiphilus sp.]|nr:transcription termination/antitermination NusG family protein [Terracidiphilus sp.]
MASNNRDCLNWFALQTRMRREHFVASALEQKGYTVFLPRSGASANIGCTEPLFPGYLFVYFNPWCRSSSGGAIITTDGVIRIVGTGKRLSPIPEAEIDSIKAAIASGLMLQPVPYVNIGDFVYIAEGPLKGVSGTIQRIKNEQRLIISISMLQRSVAVEFDIGQVCRQGVQGWPPVGADRANIGLLRIP